MNDTPKMWVQRALIFPPIAIGIAVLIWMAGGRQAPDHDRPVETAHAVRYIEATPLNYLPRATGYGLVVPGTVWEMVAEISGELVDRNPRLEPGEVLPAGTEILRIDQTDYEIALEQIDANLESVAAQLAELVIIEESTRRLLEIDRRSVLLFERDLERRRALLRRGNISETEVDAAERALLDQQRRVQDLENLIAGLPADRRRLAANRALYEAQRRQAALDLERTVIATPMVGRVALVNVEEIRFVSVGEVLVVIDSIDVAEVEAQLTIDQVGPLLRPGVALSSLSVDDLDDLPEHLGLSAEIRLRFGTETVRWSARVDRISPAIDPETRTIGAIVAVDRPYAQAVTGSRPPLVRNMYVEVELRGPLRPDTIVVPRVALHEPDSGAPVVHVIDAEDRLAFRPVTPGPVLRDLAVIDAGLVAGDRVVVTDLIPAIEGMRLTPRLDADLAAQLRQAVTGDATPDLSPVPPPTSPALDGRAGRL